MIKVYKVIQEHKARKEKWDKLQDAKGPFQRSPFILLIIVANTVCLAMDRHPKPPKSQETTLSILNLIFTAIFTFEILFKILAIEVEEFLRDRFNLFDLAIVILSCVEIGLTLESDGDDSGGGGSSIGALRAFRLFRLFKIFKVGDL